MASIALAVSAIAFILGMIAIVSKHSSEKADAKNVAALQSGLKSIEDIRSKVDREITDRISEHLRSALGNPNSVQALAAAILAHPLFLDRIASNFCERLADEEDDLSDKLNEKILSASLSEMAPELKEKVRSAVSKHITENISELLSDDEDVQSWVINALEEPLPAFVKELFTSNESFRKSMAEAMSEHIVNLLNSDE